MLKPIALSFCALALLMAGPAHAETNGDLGVTSSGSFTVTANIEGRDAQRVRITGLQDIVLAAGSVGTQANGAFSFCLYHTSPTFSLQFSTPQSNVSGANFLVGPGAPIQVSLSLTTGEPNGLSSALQNGARLINLRSNSVSETCQTGPRASMSIFTTVPVIPEQVSGAYSATFFLVVGVE